MLGPVAKATDNVLPTSTQHECNWFWGDSLLLESEYGEVLEFGTGFALRWRQNWLDWRTGGV
jgi:hypothetical protein